MVLEILGNCHLGKIRSDIELTKKTNNQFFTSDISVSSIELAFLITGYFVKCMYPKLHITADFWAM